MFNKFDSRRIEFVSNPPLPDEGRIVPDERNGVTVNKLQYFPCSNRSYFDGIEFDKNSMSLRSKLNLGVPISQVSIGQIENDPMKLQNIALHLEHQISERINSLENEPIVDPIVEPSDSTE